MNYRDEIKIESLVGEVLTHIDVDEVENIILLTTKSGRQIKIFHDQDCCESVSIETTEGNWDKLVGKVIEEARQDEFYNLDPKPGEYAESWTRTNLIFRVNDQTVISKWIGESNGYYSESVNIEEFRSRLTEGE